MSNSMFKVVSVAICLCAVLGGLVALRQQLGGMASGGSPAPTPPVFASGLTLASAKAQSQTDAKPAFVFATAQWCGPCQQMKRGPLTDPAVVDVIKARTLPVYLDVDQSPSEAASLNVMGLPTMLVLRGDRIVASLSGYADGPKFIAWLEQSVAQATTPQGP